MLQAGLDDLGDRDRDLAALLHAHKALELVCGVRPPEAPEVTLGRLRELAARDNLASRSAQLALASVLAFRGESRHEMARLVERGWDDRRFLAEETSEAVPALMAVFALFYIDELNRADALTEAMLADAQARGSVVGFLVATGRRGMVALRANAVTTTLAFGQFPISTRGAQRWPWRWHPNSHRKPGSWCRLSLSWPALLGRHARSASRCGSAGYSPRAKTGSSCWSSPSPCWNSPRCD